MFCYLFTWIIELPVLYWATREDIPNPFKTIKPLDLQIEALNDSLAEHGVRLVLTNEARDAIEAMRLNRRSLATYLRRHIHNPVVDLIRRDKAPDHGRIFVIWRQEIVLSPDRDA